MGKYRGYEKYKESGIEWLGDIPEHWKNLKIKRFTQIKRGASPRPIDDPKYFDEEGEYAWVRIADVTASNRYLEETTQRLSDLGKSFSVPLEYGELFLSIAGSVGKPIITKIKCCIHDGFVYFPELNANKEFLFYIFNSGQPYLGLGKMGTQLNLNTETVGGINIGLPPLDEQESIAHFLDRKTSQIDTLIAKKEALLEKLDEKRTALISHAVTKGLDRNVPMKDSGVEWLGDIPKHWEVKRLRFLVVMHGGSTPNKANPEFWDGEIPWISAKDLKTERLKSSVDTITDKALQETSIHIHPKNGVVIVVRGMILAHSFPVAINDIDITINQDLKVLRTSQNSEFLAILLRGFKSIILSIMEESGHGTKVLRTDLFKNVELPHPPQVEQEKIVNYVNQKTDEIDRQKAKVKEAIALLKEYRTALITNAVTGKIDVRQEASL